MALSPLGTDEVVPATFPVSTIVEAANSSQLVMLKNVKTVQDWLLSTLPEVAASWACGQGSANLI